MLSGLIAELGNHHFGSIDFAKEAIRLAKACGADFVKMQAIDSETFAGGSMPREFYKQCDLGQNGYLECVRFGEEIGIPVFFSVFGPRYRALESLPIYKVAGSQFMTWPPATLAYWNLDDSRDVVVSIPAIDEDVLRSRAAIIRHMSPMYVGAYNEAPDLALIGRYTEILGRQVGYSDHTSGVAAAFQAIRGHGARLIEKHFNPAGGIQRYDGFIYRDSLHAANVADLEAIAKALH